MGQSERSNPRADRLPDLRERGGGTRHERERADEASSRQLPPLELPPNRHWPLHESVQGSQHLPQGDRGEPQQDRHARLELPKGRLAPTDVHVASPQRRVPPESYTEEGGASPVPGGSWL